MHHILFKWRQFSAQDLHFYIFDSIFIKRKVLEEVVGFWILSGAAARNF
jgi:hypothetical protein